MPPIYHLPLDCVVREVTCLGLQEVSTLYLPSAGPGVDNTPLEQNPFTLKEAVLPPTAGVLKLGSGVPPVRAGFCHSQSLAQFRLLIRNEMPSSTCVNSFRLKPFLKLTDTLHGSYCLSFALSTDQRVCFIGRVSHTVANDEPVDSSQSLI
ncbi:hypothetical protein COCON_G00001690 [Conger conger]|uniref:Uncharacterized protein n=1 Tax=Conger conger TaxID=82655 RepID=A0A9Q1E0R4_CONCO|nr:hypothetical protein COCON_G00001690 [Conger conger]